MPSSQAIPASALLSSISPLAHRPVQLIADGVPSRWLERQRLGPGHEVRTQQQRQDDNNITAALLTSPSVQGVRQEERM
jgi:hypothetical protein